MVLISELLLVTECVNCLYHGSLSLLMFLSACFIMYLFFKPNGIVSPLSNVNIFLLSYHLALFEIAGYFLISFFQGVIFILFCALIFLPVNVSWSMHFPTCLPFMSLVERCC